VRLTRLSIRSTAVTAAVLGLVTSLLAAPPHAQAAPSLGLAATDQATALASTVDSAGTYLDATGRMVVTVTDAAAAETVEAAGFVAKVVTYSAADLARVTTALDTTARIPGTTWGVDPITNQVLVTYDDTVSASELASIEGVTTRFGTAARVEHTPGVLSPFISGGDAIFTGGARCSLGFNAQNSAGQRFFVTAGHCTNIGAQWRASSGGAVIGNRVSTSFPGNDYGVVQYVAGFTNNPGSVNLYNGTTRDITGSRTATVGETAQRSGSTTGVRSGQVTSTNATVNYPQGTVTGMIRTTICAQPGDSGGSLFAGSSALGMTSGGSGNCTTGGITFFNPVAEALSANGRGLSVY
jgi:streptogrisin D